MTSPIAYVTTRHRCPHCRKSWAYKPGAAKHMATCFADPGRKTCKTCRHDVAPSGGHDEFVNDYEPRRCAEGHEQGPSCVGCGEHPEICRCEVGYKRRPATELRVLCPDWEAKS